VSSRFRSGDQVRTQQKRAAFWTPKRGGKTISINIWLARKLFGQMSSH
jgi:hypothetical protein